MVMHARSLVTGRSERKEPCEPPGSLSCARLLPPPSPDLAARALRPYLTSMTDAPPDLAARLRSCRLCAPRFAATATRHAPRPVVWFRPGARILVAGQAPGARVHGSGRPFDDASGVRLRDWLGLTEAQFWDTSLVAIVPMAFCFPGYDAKGSDLPPPPVCRATWHDAIFAELGEIPLRVYVGGHAQRYHLATRASVTDTVRGWRDHMPRAMPLPHPSWRNTGWLKRNPWFGEELLPALRSRVREVME
ncbi:Uracil-DNA glycosylase [Salipiger marinus]|uniref:Uracil-DNA glycosylase n=2 Tax=Salipiger marinus TaxID=555512 RepID=A0A1G8TK20_9RHOB|nr:Uracil-DNA glycosylase [Salipiger marinus]